MRILCLLLALLAPAAARAETYQIGPAQSQVRFTAKLLGHGVPCSFGKFTGQVTTDSAHPNQLAAEARIEVASIETGNDRRNRHLRSPDYFDADRYPEIVFRGRSAHPAASGDFDLVGELTIKQTTKSVILHVHPLSPSSWDATAQVNRKDFGITRDAFSDKGIGDTIAIALHVQGQP